MKSGSDSTLWPTLTDVEAIWRPVSAIRVGACEGHGCIHLEAGRESTLRRAVDMYAGRFGGVDPRIAASALMFPYAKALVAPAIATLVLRATIPDLSATNAIIGIAQHLPPTLWLRTSNTTTTDTRRADPRLASVAPTRDVLLKAFIREAFDMHLLLLVERIHEVYRLSKRVLLANAAYVLCTQFSALKWSCSDVRSQATADALRIMELSGARFAGLGAPDLIDLQGQKQVRFVRTNCCLYRLIPGEEICDGCPLEVYS